MGRGREFGRGEGHNPLGVVEGTDERVMARKRGTNSATQRRECTSRKGAAFLSNVIETTIKYERTTMNAPNNLELFAGSIGRLENGRDPVSTLPFEGCEDMIKLRDYRLFAPGVHQSLCLHAINYLTTRPVVHWTWVGINISIRILLNYLIFFCKFM